MARVYVFEDVKALRDLLVEALVEKGHTVRAAADGQEGLDLFYREPADIVITDLHMPRMTGHEVMLTLRKDFPELKIIAMTGGGNVDSKLYLRVSESIGADWTVSKPFIMSEFMQGFEKIVKKLESK
ncbi:MAG: response regulator [Candidatus Hydrogenedentota bacterium]